jgi:hypothetical protein
VVNRNVNHLDNRNNNRGFRLRRVSHIDLSLLGLRGLALAQRVTALVAVASGNACRLRFASRGAPPHARDHHLCTNQLEPGAAAWLGMSCCVLVGYAPGGLTHPTSFEGVSDYAGPMERGASTRRLGVISHGNVQSVASEIR